MFAQGTAHRIIGRKVDFLFIIALIIVILYVITTLVLIFTILHVLKRYLLGKCVEKFDESPVDC